VIDADLMAFFKGEQAVSTYAFDSATALEEP